MKARICLFISLVFILSACKRTSEETGNYPSGKIKYRIVYKGDSNKKDKLEEFKFYENGQQEYVGTFNDNLRTGNWKYWYDNGQLWTECEYKNGLKHGKTKNYFKNGQLKIQGQYEQNKMSGTWVFYNEKGEKQKELTY